jgi:hypothetical protein
LGNSYTLLYAEFGGILNEILRETIERLETRGKPGLSVTEVVRADPMFAQALEDIENYWLKKANKILSELMEQIRVKIMDPETTMGDLVKALDVISNKYNLSMGKPTSFSASANLNMNKKEKLSEEELDKEIEDIKAQFISAPSHPEKTLLTDDNNADEEGFILEGEGNGKHGNT